MTATTIPYATHTLPVVTGCTQDKNKPGCQQCWAARYAATRGKHWPEYQGLATYDPATHCGRWTGEVRLNPGRLGDITPRQQPRTVFVAATGDLFHPKVPDNFRDRVFDRMWAYNQHTYLLLTKRPKAMARFTKLRAPVGWMHLYLGISICNQDEADRYMPIAAKLAVAGWKVWLSLEPLLEKVKLDLQPDRCKGLAFDRRCTLRHGHKGEHYGVRLSDGWHSTSWSPATSLIAGVVVGSESGYTAPTCSPDDIRSVLKQCQAAGVPCYVKQVPMSECDLDLPCVAERCDDCPPKIWTSTDPDEWPKDLRVQKLAWDVERKAKRKTEGK